MSGVPIKDIETQDLVRDREHHLRGVHAQLHTFLATGLRHAAAGLGARPGEVDHEDGLVVLAEDGQCDVARLVVVKDVMHVVLVDILQRNREVTSPALQELECCLQFLLALREGLAQSTLVVEHLSGGTDDDGVETLQGEPVCFVAGLRWGVVDPVVIESLFVSLECSSRGTA